MATREFLNEVGLGLVWERVKGLIPTCATIDEIEEMCDALGFQSVTIDTSDYVNDGNGDI